MGMMGFLCTGIERPGGGGRVHPLVRKHFIAATKYFPFPQGNSRGGQGGS